MTKQLLIGKNLYEVEYNSVNAHKVLDLVLDWMEKHSASSCGEGIHENDDCLIDAATLVSDIVDDVLKPKYIDNGDDDPF